MAEWLRSLSSDKQPNTTDVSLIPRFLPPMLRFPNIYQWSSLLIQVVWYNWPILLLSLSTVNSLTYLQKWWNKMENKTKKKIQNPIEKSSKEEKSMLPSTWSLTLLAWYRDITSGKLYGPKPERDKIHRYRFI